MEFTVTVAAGGRGRAFIPVPFDPHQVWGRKERHHITGTVAGEKIRGVVEEHRGSWGIMVGPMWVESACVVIGQPAEVAIAPEGPQRDDLAEDFAVALEANPDAGAFFDALAQFYRKAYLRYIDATMRRPDLRPQRIREVIALLKAGVKQRPR